MAPFRLAEEAILDIDAIWLYLLDREGLETADRIVKELFRSFYMLAEIPRSGHKRPDLTDENVLFYTRFAYLIVYEPELKPLQIHGVLHGKRNVVHILAELL